LDQVLDSDEDEELEDHGFVPSEIEESQSVGVTKKWIRCANHTLQLALKVLDKDSKFAEVHSGIVKILSSISRSPLATRDLRSSANRSVVLPCVVRYFILLKIM